MTSEGEKRIDEAWKKQVEAEKREQVEKATPETAAQGRAARPRRAPLPQASFNSLISSLAGQALMSMGLTDNPLTGRPEMDLEYAKYSIDTLQVLKDKSEGNLTDEEKRYVDAMLYDLRIRFVEAAR